MDYQDEYNQMMRDGSKNQQKFRYLMIAVVAFVVGFGLAWISFKGQDGSKVAMDDGNADNNGEVAMKDDGKSKDVNNQAGGNEEIKNPVLAGNTSLSVDNQAPGKSVFVREVSTGDSVWVVIIEDLAGVHGNILGAGLFDADEKAGVVELLRGTVEGGTYYASLYKEDSSLEVNRVFDLEKDLPFLDVSGNNIEVQFKTSALPQ